MLKNFVKKVSKKQLQKFVDTKMSSIFAPRLRKPSSLT